MSASVVLTYRAGTTPDRHQNLLATLGWLAGSGEFEAIVVEQDVLPTLTQPLPHPRCRTVFAYNPGPFNKAWGLNVGVRLAERPVLVFADADVVIHEQLETAVAQCAQKFAVVKPYRRIVDLTPEQTAEVRQGRYDYLPPPASPQNREEKGEYVVLAGGLFVMRAAAFRHLGGWDERFRGWGGEDDAMSHAIQRARMPTLELDQRPALHLWHPRSRESTLGHAHYEGNRTLAARYLAYTEAELTRLAEVTRQGMGNSQKYRPAGSQP